jgi:hypothetical protein
MDKFPCSGCGWEVEGGVQGCRAWFHALVARDFSDALFFRSHRLLVDTYSLQHPDEFCASAKSLVAHLSGLCAILEAGASMAVGPRHLHRWLDGNRVLTKPPLPDRRGELTIADLPQGDDPSAWEAAVLRWARSTWDAYASVHPTARDWLRQSENA